MKKQENLEENVNSIITSAMERLKNIIEVNTVVGSPIVINETTTILPVSRVSVGFVAGGGELNTKTKKQEYPFAGGSGSGFTIEPIGFLVMGDEIKYVTTLNDSPLSEIAKFSNKIISKVLHDKKEMLDEKNN